MFIELDMLHAKVIWYRYRAAPEGERFQAPVNKYEEYVNDPNTSVLS
jgi:hypothetical protein